MIANSPLVSDVGSVPMGPASVDPRFLAELEACYGPEVLSCLPERGTAVWWLPVVICEIYGLENSSIVEAVETTTITVDLAARHLDSIADGRVDAVRAAHYATLLVMHALSVVADKTTADSRALAAAKRCLLEASVAERLSLAPEARGYEVRSIRDMKNHHLLVGAALAASVTGRWAEYPMISGVLGRAMGVVQFVDDLIDAGEDTVLGRRTQVTQALAAARTSEFAVRALLLELCAELREVELSLNALGAPIAAARLRDSRREISRPESARPSIDPAHPTEHLKRVMPVYLQYGA